MKLVKRFLKSVGKKKKSNVQPVGQVGMRSGKAWWSWKEGVIHMLKKTKKSKMRLTASSQCRAEQVKDCRTKSLKK